MMVVKLGESLDWVPYKIRNSIIKGRRMTSDFVYETTHGWENGKGGQWLVELVHGIRLNMDDATFKNTYKPLERESDQR